MSEHYDDARLLLDNYYERKSEAQAESSDAGCYGILSMDTEDKLLRELLKEHKAILCGEEVKKYKRKKSSPRGRYINKPEWN